MRFRKMNVSVSKKKKCQRRVAVVMLNLRIFSDVNHKLSPDESVYQKKNYFEYNLIGCAERWLCLLQIRKSALISRDSVRFCSWALL